jgi:hypothetical protein
MSEENNHNDSLERFFRKKADEFDIPFREEDWLKLEKQLDFRDMQIAYRKKLRRIVVAAVLLIGVLGYFTYENHNRLNQLAGMIDGEPAPQIEMAQPIEPPLTEQDDLVARPGREIEEDLLSPDVTPDRLAELSTGRDELFTEVSEPDEPVQIDRKVLAEEYVESIGEDRELPIRMDRFPALFVTEPGDKIYGDEWLAYVADRSGLTDGWSRTGTEPERSRFSLNFAVSPDISTVNSFSNVQDPGYKIGVMGNIHLTRNLSFSSGLVFSNVRYIAAGSEYNPPGYWNEGVIPDETSAVCLILDIPLTFKYSVFNFENSRFYATAGLSSYIMLNEDYRFHYAQGGYGREESISIRNGSSHWFNNAGFSIGYELDIHPNWSLSAEPFIRVPVSGVGWGEVNLYSMGSFVSLNYRFTRR